ncbi:MAG: hypothetical protein ACLFPE_11185 [Bacteroidales bacterium]
MKKYTAILTIVLLSLATTGIGQNRWRVNNNIGVNADFSDLQAAIDSASAGDIIYIENSGTPYEGNTQVDKQLTILGPGYFLATNDSTQANKASAIIKYLYFQPGSDGSVLMGVKILEDIYLNASNLFIARNHIQNMQIASSYDCGNVIVQQNYLEGSIEDGNHYYTAIIRNNIINNRVVMSHYGTLQFHNNTVFGNTTLYLVELHNSSIKNNIIFNEYQTYQKCINTEAGFNNNVEYNVLNQPSVPGFPNNIWEAVPQDVIQYTGGPETKFYLTEGSPAIGYGQYGVDCGAFAADAPYVLSGLPPIPHIFETNIPVSGTSNSGLPVNVKIKSQN